MDIHVSSHVPSPVVFNERVCWWVFSMCCRLFDCSSTGVSLHLHPPTLGAVFTLTQDRLNTACVRGFASVLYFGKNLVTAGILLICSSLWFVSSVVWINNVKDYETMNYVPPKMSEDAIVRFVSPSLVNHRIVDTEWDLTKFYRKVWILLTAVMF